MRKSKAIKAAGTICWFCKRLMGKRKTNEHHLFGREGIIPPKSSHAKVFCHKKCHDKWNVQRERDGLKLCWG